MIKQINIKNFRCIKELSVELNNKTSIIKGQNGLGKSTILNAISWFFTDTLLTDKWGAGENDIESIVPKDLQKGQRTSVEVVFDNGTSYQKCYICEYDKYDKITGHKFDGSINGVKAKNKKTWEQELLSEIKFAPKFRNVDEARLYSDPLYVLQKIDKSQLRKFLVELGAKVSNEEVYALGHQMLKVYEDKYKGDFSVMKIDVKTNVLQYRANVKRDEELLLNVADVEVFNPAELNRLEAHKRSLIESKSKLGDSNLEIQLKELDIEISALDQERQKRILNAKNEIDDSLMNLKLEFAKEQNRINDIKTNATRDLKNKESSLSAEISNIDKQINAYSRLLEDMKYNLNRNIELGKSAINIKNSLAIQLTEAMELEYNNYTTCPNCGTSFAPNENDLAKFENDKRLKIQDISSRIEQQLKNAADAKVKCDSAKTQIEKINEEVAQMHNDKYDKLQELLEVQKQISNATNVNIDLTEYNRLNAEIKTLENKRLNPVDTRDIDIKISNIMEQKQQIKENNEFAYRVQLDEIENQILELKEPINIEYAKKSKWADKMEWTKRLNEDRAKLNDEEVLLNQVNAFLNDYMKLLNKRATNLTGINFVMQEENLGNDNMKDVCYALIDGVPFSEVNTSEKYAIGIKFIERVKDIVQSSFNVPRNHFPILADRLEGFDFEEKIRTLTTQEQLVCTRVTTDENITID